MTRLQKVGILGLVMLLGACASTDRKADEAEAAAREAAARAAAQAQAEAAAAAAAQADDTGVATVSSVVGEGADSDIGLPEVLRQRLVIYFAFDSAELSAEAQATLADHANFLSGRNDLKLRLEGHTDPRGTPEYNIGLGERRAQSVRRALGLLGIADMRLETVSYGEERLASEGEDEPSLALNRRVELVYGR
jgi:peptidoglycan-associated lipoprotein